MSPGRRSMPARERTRKTAPTSASATARTINPFPTVSTAASCPRPRCHKPERGNGRVGSRHADDSRQLPLRRRAVRGRPPVPAGQPLPLLPLPEALRRLWRHAGPGAAGAVPAARRRGADPGLPARGRDGEGVLLRVRVEPLRRDLARGRRGLGPARRPGRRSRDPAAVPPVRRFEGGLERDPERRAAPVPRVARRRLTAAEEAEPGSGEPPAGGSERLVERLRRLLAVDAGAVTAEDMARLVAAERLRRSQAEERVDADRLVRRAEVADGSQRVAHDERAEVRDPGRDLLPEARLDERLDLDLRGGDALERDRVVRDGQRSRERGTVALVAVDELHDACRLAKLEDALDRRLPHDGVEDPDLAPGLQGVRGAAQLLLARPAEARIDLVAELEVLGFFPRADAAECALRIRGPLGLEVGRRRLGVRLRNAARVGGEAFVADGLPVLPVRRRDVLAGDLARRGDERHADSLRDLEQRPVLGLGGSLEAFEEACELVLGWEI